MAFPKIDGYVVTEKLGCGSYSTVYKAHTKVGARSIVAIKCVDKSRIKNSGSAVDNLITEIRLLKTLTHPHIVHMKEFSWDNRNIYIVMEYCCGGDLSKYIQRYGRVPEKQVLYFLQQLASALKFLREKGVVHMDLKPHNLLLHKGSDGKYTLKVADFGFAQYMSAESTRSVRGSPLYMAPEMIRGDYDARVDLWSVGVIMYECLFGKAPYSSGTFKELVDKIQAKAPITIPQNSSISSGCRDLLARLLKHDPDERISYSEFFSHEYLDLEHMPSRENYEKAVSLIKQAIEVDSQGEYRSAFQLYRDSLRFLVPAVSAETDAVRRSALRAKLTRYMERAEELKMFLDRESNPGPVQKHTPASNTNLVVTCCSASTFTTSSSNEIGNIRRPYGSCNCVVNEYSNTCSCGIHRQTVAQHSQDKDSASNSKGSTRQKSPKFGLKRLFGKQNSIPYLNKNDSSITDTNVEKQKMPVGEPTNDVCRIT